MIKRVILFTPLVTLTLFGLINAVPYGRDHGNPPVRVEPAWDSPQTRELAARACLDCHGNETVWPWYSNIAPLSWFIQNHVDGGRDNLNFSEWDLPQEEAREAAESVREGEMPPGNYVWLHPQAKLSTSERAALARGLEATIGPSDEGKDGRDEDEEGDDD
jgi:mono/diheme cytochrome c family protein